MDLDTERQLVERAKTDPEAFGRLFDAYYPAILGYTVRRVGEVAAAEDIVADTFMKALRGLPRFAWRGMSIQSWLYAIATNEIRIHFRKHKFTASLEALFEEQGFEPEDEYDLVAELEAAEARLERQTAFRLAQRCLLQLPLKYQEVLVLRFTEGKKVAEIALIVGKREGTVKSLLSRGLARMRTIMAAQPVQPIATPRIIPGEGRTITVKPQEEYER
jgi:RNA polymerase sigma-70 factor (ECF subfamily)